MQAKHRKWNILSAFRLLTALFMCIPFAAVPAAAEEEKHVGGGYAATGQIDNVGYTAQLYDASNGLPTSDANYVLGASDGYIWIGGYSGIIRYDGSAFSRVDLSAALTNGRALFEDSKGRIWAGTNDNGVVAIDGHQTTHFTYKEGMPSSSIRSFAEDSGGNVYIAATAGVCFVNSDMKLCTIDDERLNGKRVLKLDRGADGVILGYTKNGSIFSLENGIVTAYYESEALGMEKISTFMADPLQKGFVYLCTDEGNVYHGSFGDSAGQMRKISAARLTNIHWISRECGRIWIASTSAVGYLDEGGAFCLLDNLPVTSGIEMLTSDYQGNIWLASSTQGVMKLAANSFVDLFYEAGLPACVTNAACIHDGLLYVGTDAGIQILDRHGNVTENALSRYLGDTRVRCIKSGKNGDIWAATYTNDMGIVYMTKDGIVYSISEKDGLPDNEVRCIAVQKDGAVLAGTNSGLAVIRNGTVVRTAGAADGIENTVFITVEEGEDGTIYAGSDGGGIYAVTENEIRTIGRDDGLTSDVIMKIKRDDTRDIYWIITSNSIQYMKDGVICAVESFPYNNNYDLQWIGDDLWVTSSHGLYRVKADDVLRDRVSEYRVYTPENGLMSTPTAHTYCELDEDGFLYIPGRSGVCRISTKSGEEGKMPIKTAISAVYFGEEQILPDNEGIFTIPSGSGRIRITASVLDYTLMNPTVTVFMEGRLEEGITTPMSSLQPLEYTGLSYGDFALHVRVLDSTGNKMLLDDVFQIRKKPLISELPAFRTVMFLAALTAAGLIVWWVLRMTVIRRQYEEIRHAKEDAETANTAKTRFLANISHELLTPINTIAGMNEMAMREDAADVPKPYFMSMMNYCFDIRDASESLLSLINDLLNLSNLETGSAHLEEQEYDTADMLRSVVKKSRERSADKGLTFEASVDPLLPCRMYGDTDKITQILKNLLSNAVKYTKTGGIIFSAALLERHNQTCTLRFSVKDTGKGIRAEDMEKLFTAFDGMDDFKRIDKQGIGLGLDISQRFADLMGGTLTCESEYGKGSEFILTLTQKMIDQTPIGDEIGLADGGARGVYVPQFIAPDADILVVDDNAKSIGIIKGLLRETSVFVSSAASIEDCLDKIKDTAFHVVFIDQMMLDAEGDNAIERIRDITPELPVYVLTDNPSASDKPYTAKGYTGYLSKPVDGITLEKTILQHIPERMQQGPSAGQNADFTNEIPWDLLWLNETEGISVPEGIRSSGGVQTFVFALRLFRDTIDANTAEIRKLHQSRNLRMLTVKIRFLGNSARLIGAGALFRSAETLAAAGKEGNWEYISENLDALLSEYALYKDRLARLHD